MATQRIRGTAEKFLLQSDRGYAVVRVRLAGDETVRAVGDLAGLTLGMEYDFVGQFQFHPSYGREFRVLGHTEQEPTSLIGMERFLASGLFKGVGVRTAERLVGQFGLRTLEVLQERPEEIAKVPGIAGKKARAIAQAFEAHRDVARLGAFLRGHDLPLHLAQKLARTYGGGAAAEQVLRVNPYQIVEDVRGIGFRTADAIARAMGVSEHAPERLAAALFHALDQAGEEGHLYLPYDSWLAAAQKLTGAPADLIREVAGGLSNRSGVVFEADEGGAVAVYLPRLHRIERNIALRLCALALREEQAAGREAAASEMAEEATAREVRPECEPSASGEERPAANGERGERGERTVIEAEGGAGGVELSDAQEAVVLATRRYSLVVLTGGPGTGKTTTVRRVVEDAARCGEQVVLTAPTGRAAKRLAASAGEEARTMHRLLEVGQQNGGRYGFGRDRSHRLEGDLFIVDEASMVDAPLFSHFLDALPDEARLLLVGDPEQLPPVGPGSVLRDVIASGAACVHELELVFRQSRHSQIVLAAHAVRAGRVPDMPRVENSEYYFIEEEDPAKTADLVVDLATTRLPPYLGLEALTGVQVLAPMRKGVCGLDVLNERLSERFAAPDAPAVRAGMRTIRLRDKLMNVKNDYERDVYNGDIGLVTRLDEDGVAVRFGEGGDGREVYFEKTACGQLVHAYAVSVHKSQGGEFPCVVLPIVREHTVLLNRQLIYTAVTRARSLLVIVGSRAAFGAGVRRGDVAKRYSRLPWRLAHAMEAARVEAARMEAEPRVGG